jgi:hypothetical protein
MVMQASRVQNKAKSFSLEVRSEILIHALNDNLPPSFKGNRKMLDSRVLRVIVKRLQEMEKILLDRSTTSVRRGTSGEFVFSPEISRAARSINRLLSRYTATPSVELLCQDDIDPKLQAWWLKWNWNPRGNAKIHFEMPMIQQIWDIAQAGRISYVKQCANCGKWLFARFSHQRFCKDNCKETFHRSNAADKQRRREWARNNYRLHKNKNVK